MKPVCAIDVVGLTPGLLGLETPNLENITIICNPQKADLPVEFVRPGDPVQTCPADQPEPGGPADQIVDYLPAPGFKEFYQGDSPKPRLSIGIGVNWVSPFGPLRIDIAKAILTQEGDETKFFSFNVGTQF